MSAPKLVVGTGQILPIFFDLVSIKGDLQYSFNSEEAFEAGIGLTI